MIEFLNLRDITASFGGEIEQAVERVVKSGWYLLGEESQAFEQEFARYIGAGYCIGTGNGLDALTLIFRAYIELGKLHAGDEVIVPANTFIASILAVTECGLTPVLVEPDPDTLEIDPSKIEQAVGPRTRAAMMVHLYGRCAHTGSIAELCRRYGLLLIEDNAQAHGCRATHGKSRRRCRTQFLSREKPRSPGRCRGSDNFRRGARPDGAHACQLWLGAQV